MACLNLCLFGPPHLELDGVPLEIKRRKTVALLVYLAMTRQSHTREALATLFWPENGPSQYQECVRVLNEELGVEPQPETTALYQKQRADGGRHPVERSFITRPQARSNLPAPLMSITRARR